MSHDKSYEVRKQAVKANSDQWVTLESIMVRGMFMAFASDVYETIGKIESSGITLTQDEIDFFNEINKLHTEENN
jgi:hypothetical protein